MYDLRVIIEDDRYWLKAENETRSELHLLETSVLPSIRDGLNIVLQQNLEVTENGFRVDRITPNKFVFYIQSGYSFFGYRLSKSKLTAFRNQLIGVLNG